MPISAICNVSKVSLLAAALALGACGQDAAPEPAPPATPVANQTTVAAVPATGNETQPGPLPNAGEQSDSPLVALDSEGLRLVDAKSGRTVPLAFGTPRATTLERLAFRGPPGIGTNSECGAGPLGQASWPDGLTLHFQDDAFVGWAMDGRGEGALTTMAGLGIGSTRAELESSYAASFEQTSLGQEFAAGELFGILDGSGTSAKVTNMWAGVSCNFR